MMNKVSLPFLGFLQASALTAYIGLIAIFFNYMGNHFNNNLNQLTGPIVMLLIFVISATITALIVLGKAGYLFWEKKYRESLMLVGWTLGWATVYLLLFLMSLTLI